MKKVLNNVELVLIISTVAAAIWGFFPSNLSTSLGLLSFMFLSCFYFFLSIFHFKTDAPKASVPHILGLIGTGLFLSILVMGVLFKFFRWEGANEMLIVGLVTMSILILFYGFRYFQTKSSVYSKILTRLIVFSVVGLCLYSISSTRIMELKFRNYPSYVNAIKEYEADNRNPEKLQKLHEERLKFRF